MVKWVVIIMYFKNLQLINQRHYSVIRVLIIVMTWLTSYFIMSIQSILTITIISLFTQIFIRPKIMRTIIIIPLMKLIVAKKSELFQLIN